MINFKLWTGRRSYADWHVPGIKRRKIWQNIFASEILRAYCSVVMPLWKSNGEASSRSYWTHSTCTVFLPIHLLTSDLCTISESQYGFQPESDTLDTVYALRTSNIQGKRRALHVAFLNLQKVLDCVPRQYNRWDPLLRSQKIPEAIWQRHVVWLHFYG